MPVFQSTEELYQVMGTLFERLKAEPTIADPLLEGELVVRFRWEKPEGEATVDLRRDPIAYTFGPSDLPADVEMIQSADVAHQFWLGRLNVAQAIATRQVIAKGSAPKALKLLPAIRPAFALYPEVLRQLGRDDLIPIEGPQRRGRGWRRLRFWRWRRPTRSGRAIDLGTLNRHFIPLVEGDVPPSPRPLRLTTWPDSPAALRQEMLRRMLLIRAFEEHLAQAYAEGALPTEAIHLSIGQEATAVGACFALRSEDKLASTHRGHGHMLAKGADLEGMLAEIYGRASGLCQGKGGSMHVTGARVGALGANGIVGASLLIAVGAALAAHQRGEEAVSLAFCGDGATNQGMFHEALNFAAVFTLPAIFIVENNQYGEFTPLAQHTRVARLADRAAAYGIPGVRVLDTPISEYAIVGAAVGAALCGQRPVAEILFSDFLTTCMDPLVNQAAKLRYMSGGQYALPLVVRTPGGAGLGMAAQHSQSLEALLTGVPGLIIIAPSTPLDAKGLLKAAIRSNNPVLFFENKLLYLNTGKIPEGEYLIPIGVADVKRQGDDVTLVAIGGMAPVALAAADALAHEGVEVEVIDPRTLVPLDMATIVRSLQKTGRLVTLEEGTLTHGFGAEITARVAALAPELLRAPVQRVAGLDIPIPYARELERAALPDEQWVRQAVLATLER